LARCWCWWRRTPIVNRAVAARVHRGRATPYLRNPPPGRTALSAQAAGSTVGPPPARPPTPAGHSIGLPESSRYPSGTIRHATTDIPSQRRPQCWTYAVVRLAVCIGRALALQHTAVGIGLFVGSLVILFNAVAGLPRVNGFQHLHWSWQAALLTTAWTLLVVWLTPGVSFASIGVISSVTPGWFKPGIVAIMIACSCSCCCLHPWLSRQTDRRGVGLPAGNAGPC